MQQLEEGTSADVFPDIGPGGWVNLARRCLNCCHSYFGQSVVYKDEEGRDLTDNMLESFVREKFQPAVDHANTVADTSRQETRYFFKFTFLGANGLRPADASELADPYIRIVYQGVERCTKVRPETLDPYWNEQIIVGPVTDRTAIEIELWDSDPASILHVLGEIKKIRSRRGLKIYLRDLFKRRGDDFLGSVSFKADELGQGKRLFCKDVIFASKASGKLSFYAELECADDDLPRLCRDQYFLSLFLLVTEMPDIQQLCWKHILSASARLLLLRHGMGLSDAMRTICLLQAVQKSVVRYSLQINAAVMYDLAQSLTAVDLNELERACLTSTCVAYNKWIQEKLTFDTFSTHTPAGRLQLMGILAFSWTLGELGSLESLKMIETAINSYILRLARNKTSEIAELKGRQDVLPFLLQNLNRTTLRLRELDRLLHMAWGRDLADVASDSLVKFVLSYQQDIRRLRDPGDALKIYQIFKVFCDHYRLPTSRLSYYFADDTLIVWLQQLELEAPFWSQYLVGQDLAITSAICSRGSLITATCEEFLSRLRHTVGGLYALSSRAAPIAEAYSKTLCCCGLEYVSRLADAAERCRHFMAEGYSSSFSQRMCIVINNMASVYTLLVVDLRDIVESREASEREQWKHLAISGEEIFDRWSPRQPLSRIRRIFEKSTREFAERLAGDLSEIIGRVCESKDTKDLYRATNRLSQLLTAMFDEMRTWTYVSIFRLLIERVYEIVLDNLVDILESARTAKPDDEFPVLPRAVYECCDILEAFFFDADYALPAYKVKTPKLAWARLIANRLSGK